MILRDNHHGINVLARKQLAKVAVGDTSLVTVVPVDETLDFLSSGLGDVTDGNHPSGGIIQERFCVASALTAGADAAYRDTLAWGDASASA
jgi:hypothetical protein